MVVRLYSYEEEFVTVADGIVDTCMECIAGMQTSVL